MNILRRRQLTVAIGWATALMTLGCARGGETESRRILVEAPPEDDAGAVGGGPVDDGGLSRADSATDTDPSDAEPPAPEPPAPEPPAPDPTTLNYVTTPNVNAVGCANHTPSAPAYGGWTPSYSLDFVNPSDLTVRVDWVNGSGGLSTYGTISPGGSFHVSITYVKHYWQVTGPNGQCIQKYVRY